MRTCNLLILPTLVCFALASATPAVDDAAGQADTLKSYEPFSVFAPTDVPSVDRVKGIVAMQNEPINRDKRTVIVSYRVVEDHIKTAHGDATSSMVQIVGGGSIGLEAQEATLGAANLMVTGFESSKCVGQPFVTVKTPKTGNRTANAWMTTRKLSRASASFVRTKAQGAEQAEQLNDA